MAKTPRISGEARMDISVSVILGGLISMAIDGDICRRLLRHRQIPSPMRQVLLCSWSHCSDDGPGMSSASASSPQAYHPPSQHRWQQHTPPPASCGWKRDLHSWRFRMVWMFILLAGTLFSMLGFKPLEAILFAQAANGILAAGDSRLPASP
ncbi:MAG: hypothetical protein MZV63_32320 [Marinilabiliales bacterium]|nr:hypothetical protein [Marinilabiliales bacterium]